MQWDDGSWRKRAKNSLAARNTQPVSKTFRGDPTLAAGYLSLANVLLGELENKLSLGGVACGSRLVKLADGTLIRVSYNSGIRQIQIDAQTVSSSLTFSSSAITFLLYPRTPAIAYGLKVVTTDGVEQEIEVTPTEYSNGRNSVSPMEIDFRYDALLFSTGGYKVEKTVRQMLGANQFFRGVTGEIPPNQAIQYFNGIHDNLRMDRSCIYSLPGTYLAVFIGNGYRLNVQAGLNSISLNITDLGGDVIHSPLDLYTRTYTASFALPWSFNSDGSKVAGLVYEMYDPSQANRYRAYAFEVDITKEVLEDDTLSFAISVAKTTYTTTESTTSSSSKTSTEAQLSFSFTPLQPPYTYDTIVCMDPEDPLCTRTIGYKDYIYELTDVTWTPITNTTALTPVWEFEPHGFIRYSYTEDSSAVTSITGTWPYAVYYNADDQLTTDTISFSSTKTSIIKMTKTQDMPVWSKRREMCHVGAFYGPNPDSDWHVLRGSGTTDLEVLGVETRLSTVVYNVNSTITRNGAVEPFSNYDYTLTEEKSINRSYTYQEREFNESGCTTEPTEYGGYNYLPGFDFGSSEKTKNFTKTCSYTKNEATSGAIRSLLVHNGPMQHSIYSVTDFSGSYDVEQTWEQTFTQTVTYTPVEDYCFLNPAYFETTKSVVNSLNITDSSSSSRQGQQTSSLSTGHALSSDSASVPYGTTTKTLTLASTGEDETLGSNLHTPQFHEIEGSLGIKITAEAVRMIELGIPVPSSDPTIIVNSSRSNTSTGPTTTTNDSTLLSTTANIMSFNVLKSYYAEYNNEYVLDYNWVVEKGKLYWVFNIHGIPIRMRDLFSSIPEIRSVIRPLSDNPYNSQSDRVNIILCNFGRISSGLSLPGASGYYITVRKN